MLRAVLYNAKPTQVQEVVKSLQVNIPVNNNVAVGYVRIYRTSNSVVIEGADPVVVFIACEVSRKFNVPVKFVKLGSGAGQKAEVPTAAGGEVYV